MTSSMPEPHSFSDQQADELLRTLYCYIEFYDIHVDSISELAIELAQSQDYTNVHSDEIRRVLEARFEPAP